MDLAEYLKDIPKLHSWDNGKSWNTGGFEAKHLQTFYDLIVNNGCKSILETGAGNSTIAFLLTAPVSVISICPDPDLFQRIAVFCGDAISREPLTTLLERSEWVLPTLAKEKQVDFALIDGGHGMPTVFVDLFYINFMVRKGGFIALDDTQLHSVAEAVAMLREQPQFEVQTDLGKTVIFRKIADFKEFPDFGGIPYKRRSV